MRLIDFGDNVIYVIDEIIKESSSSNDDTSLINSLLFMNKFVTNIDLLSDNENNLYYSVDLNTLLKSNIEESDFFTLCCQGWVLSDNKKCIIKKI